MVWLLYNNGLCLERVDFTCRFGKPSEIGGVVAFLVSDDASYMTGETMVVGGGYPTRL